MSPIPTTHSPQPKMEMIPSLPKEEPAQNVYAPPLQSQLPQQQQQQQHHQQQQQQAVPTSMMDPSAMMFNETMIGLGQGMDTSFFQEMTGAFTMPQQNQHHHHHHQQPPQQQPSQQQHHLHHPPPHQPQHHQAHHQAQQDMTSMFANPMLAGTFGNNDGAFGLDQGLYGAPSYSSFVPHPQQHQVSNLFNTIQTSTPPSSTPVPNNASSSPSNSNTNNNNNNSNSNNNSNNSTSNIPSMFGTTPTTSGLPISSSGDPPMDGLLNMDSDTMNAFLQYNTASFSAPFGYHQSPSQQQQQQQMMPSDMMFTASNRKRQREWDQQEN
jgi:hypothetical protein